MYATHCFYNKIDQGCAFQPGRSSHDLTDKYCCTVVIVSRMLSCMQMRLSQ